MGSIDPPGVAKRPDRLGKTTTKGREMTLKLKALGLALVAALAMSAVAATSASASFAGFHSTAAHTTLAGTSENTHSFVRSGVNLTCTHAVFTGTQSGTTTSTVETQVDYTTNTCHGPLGSSVHVDFTTGECGYHFTLTASKTAVAKLVCKKVGGSATITPTAFGSSLCTIHVPPQTVDGHVTFTNLAGGDVTANSTASGIDSTRTGSSACGAENDATGTYSGNVVLNGGAANLEVT